MIYNYYFFTIAKISDTQIVKVEDVQLPNKLILDLCGKSTCLLDLNVPISVSVMISQK